MPRPDLVQLGIGAHRLDVLSEYMGATEPDIDSRPPNHVLALSDAALSYSTANRIRVGTVLRMDR